MLMPSIRTRTAHLAFLFILFCVGCDRSTGPKPLALEEIPGALRQAFQPARLLVKQGAESIAKLVEQKQYAAATIQLQSLLPQELSDQQREVASAALQTLNQKLQELAATVQPSEDGSAPKPPSEPVKAEEAAAAAAVMDQYIRTK